MSDTPENMDAPVLTSLDSGHLSEVFRNLVEQNRQQLAPFKPALERMNALVSKLHDVGISQVGIEIADLESLRSLNILRKSKRDVAEQKVTYCILSIYDARFVLRVLPDAVVDCHCENINRPSVTPQALDSNEFWYRKIDDEYEARMHQYDLKQDQDCIDFVSNIVEIAATCAAQQELRDSGSPSRPGIQLFKKPLSLERKR